MFFLLLLSVLLLLLLLIYFHIADSYNIIDKPNQRSSHSTITIRGGGIVFPLAVLLWFLFYGFGSPSAVLGLLAIASVSLVDDIRGLSWKVRIVVHLLAVSLLFYTLGVFGLSWWLIAVVYILTIGFINAFNFMDGINGITVLYALVSLLSFSWLNQSYGFVSPVLLHLLLVACSLFGWFNLRKRARCFAGDVGSVSLAFVLAWLMIRLIMHTGRPEYILFFSVYAIDSVFTIIHRLIKRENIFQAHRSHLYQYLSNELSWPHVQVSLIYALVQAVVNTTVIVLIHQQILTLWLGVGMIALQSAIYLIIRFAVLRRIALLAES